jgi:hypothetical protein
MFSPVYSPLTSGYRAKAINMSSRGAYFVSGNPVLLLGFHLLLVYRTAFGGAPRRKIRPRPQDVNFLVIRLALAGVHEQLALQIPW